MQCKYFSDCKWFFFFNKNVFKSLWYLYIRTVITVLVCLVSKPCLSSCSCSKREKHFLLSLPTWSNQDREHVVSRILLFAAMCAYYCCVFMWGCREEVCKTDRKLNNNKAYRSFKSTVCIWILFLFMHTRGRTKKSIKVWITFCCPITLNCTMLTGPSTDFYSSKSVDSPQGVLIVLFLLSFIFLTQSCLSFK